MQPGRHVPALDLDRMQLARLDQLGHAWPDRVGGQPEVVAQLGQRGHAERARGDRDELALGVLLARGRRGEHRAREHALGQVVEALEVAAAGARHLAAPEQHLDRALGVRPVPPRARLAWALTVELTGGERAALADLLEHVLEEVRLLLRDAAHPAPRLVVGALHPPPQQRLQLDVDQARLVAPVLEQPPRRVVGGFVERLAVVGAEAREARQVVRAREHVDRVDLDERDAVEQPPDGPAVGPARLREALRGEGDAPRLGGWRGGRGASAAGCYGTYVRSCLRKPASG